VKLISLALFFPFTLTIWQINMKTKQIRLKKPIAKSDGVFADHDPQRLNKNQRLKKECIGCGDYFTCYRQDNYDYCRSCAINGNRYCQNQCPECGDGSG